ncbi:MAG TPA: N-acetylmuramic acid 6-phosphate etherase [Bacteroidota bacterium]|nr:N-acetylmuramic acid 6-phosphate etherase [Bacteroidota bacterium]
MKLQRKIFEQLEQLTTEEQNYRSARIDGLTISGCLKLINREDRSVASAVGKEIPYIARAVKLVTEAFQRGGRLIYVGAGTSGRLGVIDAAECPPTYGTSPLMVRGIIAGGRRAVFKSQEGAEDSERNGMADVRKLGINKKDVVCGIAASMRTPYVRGALREAKASGAKTILITTNPRRKLNELQYAPVKRAVDVAICPVVGPEVIMGSTRMKSGTAQKLILNMISTTAMIRIGKVYGNMMVDLKTGSRKLKERAKRVVMISAGVGYEEATRALGKAGGHVKTAIVMLLRNVQAREARNRLHEAGGFVRTAIGRKTV